MINPPKLTACAKVTKSPATAPCASSVAVIVDGAGTYKDISMNEEGSIKAKGCETESVWQCEYPANFSVMHKVFGDNFQQRMVNDKFDVGNSVTIVKAYEAVTNYLGFFSQVVPVQLNYRLVF